MSKWKKFLRVSRFGARRRVLESILDIRVNMFDVLEGEVLNLFGGISVNIFVLLYLDVFMLMRYVGESLFKISEIFEDFGGTTTNTSLVTTLLVLEVILIFEGVY